MLIRSPDASNGQVDMWLYELAQLTLTTGRRNPITSAQSDHGGMHERGGKQQKNWSVLGATAN
jgi:hypothetical protein